MNKLKVVIIISIVAASLIASMAIQHGADLRRRVQDNSFREQAEKIAKLSAQNERLTNLVAQVKKPQPLSREQLRELLRLRNEVGQLRQVGTDKVQLQASNAQLRAVAAQAEQKLAEAQAAPNYWAKDQLAFAGYADPESAMKSILAVMKSGDFNSWQAVCTPGAITNLQNEWKKHGLSEEQQMAAMKSMADTLMSSSSGFHIIEQTMPAPDKAIINLSFDGEGKARKFVLKEVNSQWKFDDLMVAGQENPPSQ